MQLFLPGPGTARGDEYINPICLGSEHIFFLPLKERLWPRTRSIQGWWEVANLQVCPMSHLQKDTPPTPPQYPHSHNRLAQPCSLLGGNVSSSNAIVSEEVSSATRRGTGPMSQRIRIRAELIKAMRAGWPQLESRALS